jgi:uncharacterized protein (DUF362 family)
MSEKPKVIIRSCDTYDAQVIRGIIRDGLDELGLHPRGRTLVKPNLVATGNMFTDAYTRAEFMEGVLLALRDRDLGEMTELAVGERCGITIPTRHAYRQADYGGMFRRLGMKRYCFEDEQQVEIPLSHEGRLRDYLFTPEPVARADFFVNCPKFKAHPWTTVTFSMKNYIGIQDDRHRLIDHDHRLGEKVADLQYILQPQFIAIDGIMAGQERMLTPTPFPLRLIVMGVNQVAFDSVCCQIIGIDPLSVEHIRLAHERGFGPVALSEIELSGDVTLDEARRRGEGFKAELIRVERYFEGTSISAYAGPPPDSADIDYCWGGCPGALEEAIEILRRFDAETDRKMPRLHIVFGAYRGLIPAKPGEKVVFLGDCVDWHGELHGEPVSISSAYRDRKTKDPYHAVGKDLLGRMAATYYRMFRARKRPFLHLPGCPVSVSEQVLTLVSISGAKNPYFDPNEVVGFARGYLASKIVALTSLRPYQRPGQCHRGQSATRV